jgi:hypothetical protein
MKGNKISIDEILSTLPRPEQVIVKKLRALIHEVLPHVTEKNNYGAPFYTRNRMMVFIWPPSIQWGPKKKDTSDKGVALGFCQGNLMSNEDGILLQEGRKQVFCMYFRSVKEIDDNILRALLYEADMIDQQFKKTKIAKTTKRRD